jgi:hypothetical protein
LIRSRNRWLFSFGINVTHAVRWKPRLLRTTTWCPRKAKVSVTGVRRVFVSESSNPNFLHEERCHGSLLLLRILSRPFVLVRTGRGADEEEEVIRVPKGKHDRTPVAPVVIPGLARPSLRRRGVAPRGRDSALQDMPLISFLDHTEGDVRKQGRENPALWRAGIATEEGALRENAGVEERDEQAVHLGVGDPAAYPLHQTMVVDVVEASLDISLDDPLVREP